jgi:hypothetical protein
MTRNQKRKSLFKLIVDKPSIINKYINMNKGDQTNAGGDQSFRFQLTPSWETVAKISIEALLNGTTNGQSMAREEILDMGIKLDDAKEILEGQKVMELPEVLRKSVDEKNKTILDLNERAREMERQLNKLALGLANYQRNADKDLEYIQQLEAKLLDKDPEYDAELANGDGQDTSINEQSAEYVSHREGDE